VVSQSTGTSIGLAPRFERVNLEMIGLRREMAKHHNGNVASQYYQSQARSYVTTVGVTWCLCSPSWNFICLSQQHINTHSSQILSQMQRTITQSISTFFPGSAPRIQINTIKPSLDFANKVVQPTQPRKHWSSRRFSLNQSQGLPLK
jgi:hypothetical protein